MNYKRKLNITFLFFLVASIFIASFNPILQVLAVDVEITTDGEYDSSNAGSNYSLENYHPSATTAYSAGSQSFCTLNDGKQYTLKYVRLSLQKANSPTGNAYVKIYAHTGTFGTSSAPTGSALATSDAINVASLSAVMSVVNVTFSGDNQITLDTNTYYVITYENPASGTIDSTNHVHIGVDASSPSHEGNAARYRSSAWTTQSGHDLAAFGVYGEEVPSGTAYVVDLSQSVTSSYNVSIKADFKTTHTQTATTSYNLIVQSNFKTQNSLGLTFTWTVDVLKGAMAYVADLSFSISNTYSFLTRWTANINLTQTLTSAWNFLVKSSFNIQPTLNSAFTWAIDVIHTLHGVGNYIVDFTLGLSSTWNILTQWNALAILNQGISSTWNINLIQGLQRIADLTLDVISAWSTNISLVQMDAFTVALAIGVLGLIFALAAISLVMLNRRD